MNYYLKNHLKIQYRLFVFKYADNIFYLTNKGYAMSKLTGWLKVLSSTILINIIVMIIFFVVGWLGKDLIPHLMRKYSYSGPDISGQWYTDFAFDGITGEEEVILMQSGNKITGTIHTITTREDSTKRILDSDLYGEFRDEYLVAYYVPKENDRIGCGSYTFRLIEGGNRLEGICPFQYTQDRELKLLKYGWNRLEGYD